MAVVAQEATVARPACGSTRPASHHHARRWDRRLVLVPTATCRALSASWW